MKRHPEYLSQTPREPRIDGRLIVHNHVVPAEPLGMNGFRAWLVEPDESYNYEVEPCPCDWAPEAGAHYRVVRDERRTSSSGR